MGFYEELSRGNIKCRVIGLVLGILDLSLIRFWWFLGKYKFKV